MQEVRRYKISKEAKAVITDNKKLRDSLAKLLGVQDRMVMIYLRENRPNNKLVLKPCLSLIEDMTILTESQILEEVIVDNMEMELHEGDVHVEKKEEVQTDLIWYSGFLFAFGGGLSIPKPPEVENQVLWKQNRLIGITDFFHKSDNPK